MDKAAQRIAGATAAAVMMAAALAGCTSTTHQAGGTVGSSPPSGAPSSAAPEVTLGTGAATPDATAAAPPTAAATPGAPGATAGAPRNQPGVATTCTGSQIRQSTGYLGAGMGHEGEALVFTNTSGSTCTMSGYPGAKVSKPGGASYNAARVMAGYLGGANGYSSPPTVTLTPGGTASALLMWTDVGDPHAPCQATDFTELQTTTPNTQSTVSYPASGSNGDYTCENMQVTPVVPGASGHTQQ